MEEHNLENGNKQEEKERVPRKKPTRKRASRGTHTALHILQHICLVLAVVIAFYVVASSYVELEDGRGEKQYYQVSNSADGSKYEDSALFNNILGRDLTDVICYGAIRNQMETNGVYDGSKEIDVTAFVNRYNGIPNEYITVKYRLEDLLKWAQNGFTYSEIYMTGQDADEFLSRMRTVTTVDLSSSSYSSSAISYLNSDVESKTTVQDVSGNVILEDGQVSLRDDVNATVMTNKYPTVDGKYIEDYVSSWEEYYELCNNVKSAAEDLLINYELYLGYHDYFEGNETNVYYVIRSTIGKNTTIYTNTDSKATAIKNLDTLFQENYGRYIRYNPADIEAYNTNTLIEETTVRYVTRGYSYAFPENTQIWIGVDTAYPVMDNLARGNQSYMEYQPYSIQLWIAVAMLAALYLILLVILTLKEGWGKNADGKPIRIMHAQDAWPTEIMLVTGCGMIAILCYGVYRWLVGMMGIGMFITENTELAMVLLCITAWLVSMLFSFYYYSLIRRIKGHNLWSDSLLCQGCHLAKKGILYVFDHANLLLRIWIPVAVLIVINTIGLYGLVKLVGLTGILIIVVIDFAIGVLFYKASLDRQIILEGINRIKDGDVSHKINEEGLHGDNLVLAQAVNNIGDGIESAVQTSMKDERMKADLITNVSHDIKTPLTSIINYVDLIKRENVENPKVREYISVLDEKSQKLKQLTDDLVEASKISSGNISLQWEKINLLELINQTIGEFSEKFEQKGLTTVLHAKENHLNIVADSRRIWRVIENLFNNICKYALEGTRVYIELQKLITQDNKETLVILSIKNISANPLNVTPDELTERFIRGDESRTTEGSGLGLSIAKSLTEAQNGSFEIQLDGDLFKVILTFPLLQ